MTDDIDPRDADESDELEAEILRADHAFGSGLFGTTAEEARAGEGLDRALAQERPDETTTDETLEIVDDGPQDDEIELIGDAVRERDVFAPPEEAALTVRDDAPGATDNDDQHPPGEDRAMSGPEPSSVSRRPPDGDLRAEEERLWTELQALVDSLPLDKVDEPGYFEEGWSAKDLVAHLGSWLAEAGVVLERIRFGTYRREEIDVDAMNGQFFEALHDVPFGDIRAQGIAARNRMLRAWGSLETSTPEAEFWIAKAGPEHYDEHMPRLRDWVGEIS
jgi:hypothetical protein